ncbi:C6 zinc finger protein [Zopfia rhizophila CBS 207.26]|uniref:C6 zinc finger protein n=1 Tax=Zopfia rhizophila CBS 207.26 TaxID=1314779 RepID=A0A6A6EB56_9PEZI|nr:C6 zinc finger protein [Zopfia rhizophila CBS 207.26]
MVYCGKPSRACENCRKLHVKCDERRPECSQCMKMKRTCLGYRDQLSLVFRDENTKTQRRVRGAERNGGNLSPKKQPSMPIKQSNLPTTPPHDRHLHKTAGFGKNLLPPLEDSVVYHFYSTILASVLDGGPVRYLHSLLPDLYNQSAPHSPLRLAAQAISYATSAKSRPDLERISRLRYVQAISALSAAIRDPNHAKDDQTLYAVLLLSGQETITCEVGTPLAYGTHIDGAATLIRHRGMEQLHEQLSSYLFHFVRRDLVLSHMQIAKPVDTIFYEHSEFIDQTQEDRLVEKIIDIPNLQSQANIVLGKSTCPANDRSIFELINASKILDSRISDWARNALTTSSYTITTNVSMLSSTEASVSDFSPPRIYRYSDIHLARTWNIYRVSRLIVLSIIIRAVSRLDPTSIDAAHDLERLKAGGRQRELVNDICASVPFLLRHNVSRIAPPLVQSRLKLDGKGDIVTKTGRYSLIWPLYVGSSVPSIPENQRRWMRAQLKWIGESGKPQAKLLASSNCQTLLGGTEKFRFYCA